MADWLQASMDTGRESQAVCHHGLLLTNWTLISGSYDTDDIFQNDFFLWNKMFISMT